MPMPRRHPSTGEPSPQEPRWLAGSADWKGEFAFLGMVSNGEQWKRRYPHRLTVVSTILTVRPDGYPDADDSRSLRGLEDSLIDSTVGRAALVGKLTTLNRTREFWFYSGANTWIPEWAAARRAEYPHRNLEFRVVDDPEWNFYRAALPIAQRANADRIILSKMDEAGIDRDEVCELDFSFFFATQELAEAAAQTLRDHDYRVLVEPPPAGQEWSVTATTNDRPSVWVISYFGTMFDRFATEHGGTFDGWGTAISAE